MLFWRMWFIISPLMAMKLDKSNPTDVMVNNTFEDLEEMADMPNPGTNSNDAEANLGIGRLAANMEFLLLKVAELDTWQTWGLLSLGSVVEVWVAWACP